MVTWIKKQWFLLTLLSFIVLAALVPQLGNFSRSVGIDGFLPPLLFLFLGYGLDLKEGLDSLKNPQGIIISQIFIFMIFPIIVWIISLSGIFSVFSFGCLVLGILPTSVSSSGIYAHQANGNASLAVINSSISNAVGLIISPLLLSIITSTGLPDYSQLPITEILLRLMINMVLPLALGIIAQMIVKNKRFSSSSNEKLRHSLQLISKYGSRIGILFMVLFALSGSALFESSEYLLNVIVLILSLVAIHFLTGFASFALAGSIKLSHRDKIAVFFNSSQKTLIMGLPLIRIFFMDDPKIAAFVMLPLLIYHPLQMVLSALTIPIFQRIEKKTT